ncbi:DUF3810 domain-containing protein [Mucilaginibacter sp. PAMB04274]|uniref:DUF3810 domain-containing protein n=1 Tax=Mucilaginibacter sp. PAMB04274 TaxID=3138568 RepID=UPI0031F6E5D4
MIEPAPVKAFSDKKAYALIAGLGVLLALLFTAGYFPNFIERYYSTGLYQFIGYIAHSLLGWVPFSLGDLFYFYIISYLLYSLWRCFRNIRRKNFRLLWSETLKFIIKLQLFIGLFYLMWGLNYFRPPAAAILNLPNKTYSSNQLQKVTRLLIDSTNSLRSSILRADTLTDNKAIFDISKQAVQNLGKFSNKLQSTFPSAKPSLFTPVINYMTTAGYFNPFTGEAQINYAMPIVDRPITSCHEMAHQIGFAREDEANFVGFLAGIKSSKKLLRYSAYYMAMQEFMQQVRRQDTVVFNNFKKEISPAVKTDLKVEHLYWQHYQNQLGYITSVFYDNFLKANNQPEGLRTYNRMINLTMAYYSQ